MKRKRSKPAPSLTVRLKGSAMHEVTDLAGATAATPEQAASVLISIGADAINGGRNRVAYLEFVAHAKRAAALKRQAEEANTEAAALTRNARKMLESRTGDGDVLQGPGDAADAKRILATELLDSTPPAPTPKRPRKRKTAEAPAPAVEAP